MGDSEDNNEEEEEKISYRGAIAKTDWDEFKGNVPHATNLMDKVNELIREFNESKRDRDRDGCNNS